jgi:hypothetical protein
MSRIARQARHAGKKKRNRISARRAYDAILRYLPASNLSAQEAQEIETGLSELRSELQNLGEVFCARFEQSKDPRVTNLYPKRPSLIDRRET